MALHLTPEMLETCYELLRTTPPFRGWKLPHADEVEFIVSHMRDMRGEYQHEKGHRILISAKYHATLASLILTMAHEMCHLREKTSGCRMDIGHGADFRRIADRVCRAHVFDRKAF